MINFSVLRQSTEKFLEDFEVSKLLLSSIMTKPEKENHVNHLLMLEKLVVELQNQQMILVDILINHRQKLVSSPEKRNYIKATLPPIRSTFYELFREPRVDDRNTRLHNWWTVWIEWFRCELTRTEAMTEDALTIVEKSTQNLAKIQIQEMETMVGKFQERENLRLSLSASSSIELNLTDEDASPKLGDLSISSTPKLNGLLTYLQRFPLNVEFIQSIISSFKDNPWITHDHPWRILTRRIEENVCYNNNLTFAELLHSWGMTKISSDAFALSIHHSIFQSKTPMEWMIHYLSEFTAPCDPLDRSTHELKRNESLYKQKIFGRKYGTAAGTFNPKNLLDLRQVKLLDQTLSNLSLNSSGFPLWYHATSLTHAYNILQNGITLNKGHPYQDFSESNGFYLGDNFDLALKFSRSISQGVILMYALHLSTVQSDVVSLAGNTWKQFVFNCRSGATSDSSKLYLGPICENPWKELQGYEFWVRSVPNDVDSLKFFTHPKGLPTPPFQICVQNQAHVNFFNSSLIFVMQTN